MHTQRYQAARRTAVLVALSCLACGGPGGLTTTGTILGSMPPDLCIALMWPASEMVVGPDRAELNARDSCRAAREGLAGQRSTRARPASGAASVVSDTVEVSGNVPSKQIPVWVGILPASGATANLITSVSVTDSFGLTADVLPGSFQATLYAVDKQGKRTRVGRKNAKFSKKEGGATAGFSNARKAVDHYEVEIKLSRGSVRNGNVIFAAGIAGASNRRIGPARTRVLTNPAGRRTAPARVLGGLGMSSVGASGTVSAGKLQGGTIRVTPADVRGGARNAVFGFVFVVDADLNPPPVNVSTVKFTAYDTDANGKRKKIASMSTRVDRDTGSGFADFGNLKLPRSHYEIVAEASGGSLTDAVINYSVIASDPAALARTGYWRWAMLARDAAMPAVFRSGSESLDGAVVRSR